MSDRCVIAVIAALLFAVILAVVWFEYQHPCVRGHYERQLVYMQNVGSVSVPVYGDVFVCDERKAR